MQAADPVCDAGDMDACAAALRDIRRLRPQDATVKAVPWKPGAAVASPPAAKGKPFSGATTSNATRLGNTAPNASASSQ